MAFKNKLIGERIILKRTKPLLKTAKTIFSEVDSNREHLEPWFPWVKPTKKIEDTLEYLFKKEEKTKEGKTVEYGIYSKNNEYMGNIGIFDINKKRKSAEVGYWISSRFTRKGYATEAVKIIMKEFFENMDLNRLQLKCDKLNIPSAKVAKKCGFTFEGELREDAFSEFRNEFRHTLIFSMLKSEWEKQKSKK